MSEARFPLPSHNPAQRSTASRVIGGLAPAVGVVLAIASPGVSNQGMVHQAPARAAIQQVQLGSRIFTVRSTNTTFNDSGSGTITLSGTGVESFSVNPPPVTLQGSTQSSLRAPVPAEAIQSLRGPRIVSLPPPAVFTDSGSGSISLSGSGVESFAVLPPPLALQAGTQGVYKAPVPADVAQALRVGRISTPSTPASFSDSGSGSITLSGSGVEVFQPPVVQFSVASAGGTNQGGVSRPVVRAIVPETHAVSAALSALNTNGGGYAVTPVPAPLALQGASNQSQSTQQVPQPPPWEQKVQQPGVFFGYNAAPPTYSVIVAGSTNQGYQMHKPAPAEAPVSPLGSRLYTVTAATSTTFTDSGSGTITLSGSGVELFVGVVPGIVKPGRSSTVASSVPPVEAPQVLLGSRALYKPRGAVSFVDSGSGTIVLSGSTVESASGTGSGSGTITLSGTKTESLSTSDSGSGSITLAGSATDSWTAIGAGSGTITLDGSAASNEGSASYAAVNIDAPYVLSVHPLKSIADQRKWRRLTREVLGEDLIVYGLPMSAFGSSIVYVVWNLDENQIVSVHESSQQATDAIRRRLIRTGRGNYVVYTMDT